MDWLDVARGVAIILVVYHHTLLYLGELDIRSLPYVHINNALKPIRMPLFFFCAGITASFVVHRAASVFYRRRLVPLLWVLVVWTGIYVLADQVLPMRRDGAALHYNLIDPQMNLWFVWVLAVMTLAAPLLQRLNSLIVLPALAGLAVAWEAGILPSGGGILDPNDMQRILLFGPFYAAGLYFARPTIAFFDNGPRALAALAASLAVFAALLYVSRTMPGLSEPTSKLARVVGVAVGISGACLLARAEGVRRLFAQIGARSLEVFLGHQLFIAIAAALIVAAGKQGASALWILPAIVLVSVLGSLALRRAADAVGLDLLYGLRAAPTNAHQEALSAGTPPRRRAALLGRRLVLGLRRRLSRRGAPA